MNEYWKMWITGTIAMMIVTIIVGMIAPAPEESFLQTTIYALVGAAFLMAVVTLSYKGVVYYEQKKLKS